MIHCNTARIACQFAELLSKVDGRTGQLLEDAPHRVRANESAIVKIVPLKPMCVETYAECPSLGRFTVHDMRRIVAIGVIQTVEKRTINTSMKSN